MPIPNAYQSRNAPWNEQPAPECPDCSETITEGADHAQWCAEKRPQDEIMEYWAEQQPGANIADRREL